MITGKKRKGVPPPSVRATGFNYFSVNTYRGDCKTTNTTKKILKFALVRLFACLLACLLACLFVCLFVCLLACLFVCLFFQLGR